MGGKIGPTKTRDQRLIALPARTQETLELWRGESPFEEDDHLIFYGMAADKPLNVKTVTDLFPAARPTAQRSRREEGSAAGDPPDPTAARW